MLAVVRLEVQPKLTWASKSSGHVTTWEDDGGGDDGDAPLLVATAPPARRHRPHIHVSYNTPHIASDHLLLLLLSLKRPHDV